MVAGSGGGSVGIRRGWFGRGGTAGTLWGDARRAEPLGAEVSVHGLGPAAERAVEGRRRLAPASPHVEPLAGPGIERQYGVAVADDLCEMALRQFASLGKGDGLGWRSGTRQKESQRSIQSIGAASTRGSSPELRHGGVDLTQKRAQDAITP